MRGEGSREGEGERLGLAFGLGSGRGVRVRVRVGDEPGANLSARGSVAPTNQLVMPSLRTWCTHVRAKSIRTMLTKVRSSFLSTAMVVTLSLVNEVSAVSASRRRAPCRLAGAGSPPVSARSCDSSVCSR